MNKPTSLFLALAIAAGISSCQKDDADAPRADEQPGLQVRTMTVGPQSYTGNGVVFPNIYIRSKHSTAAYPFCWEDRGQGTSCEQGDSIRVMVWDYIWDPHPGITATLVIHGVGSYTCTSANPKWIVP